MTSQGDEDVGDDMENLHPLPSSSMSVSSEARVTTQTIESGVQAEPSSSSSGVEAQPSLSRKGI